MEDFDYDAVFGIGFVLIVAAWVKGADDWRIRFEVVAVKDPFFYRFVYICRSKAVVGCPFWFEFLNELFIFFGVLLRDYFCCFFRRWEFFEA